VQVEAETFGFLTGHIVEKVNYVSSKSIFDSSTFLEVERTGRIYFYFLRIWHSGAELALEFECSLPHLRHGESYNVVGHKSESRMAEDDSNSRPRKTRTLVLAFMQAVPVGLSRATQMKALIK